LYKIKVTHLKTAESTSKLSTHLQFWVDLSILGKSLQLHNLPVNCARELFKPSKDFTTPLVSNEKQVLGFL